MGTGEGGGMSTRQFSQYSVIAVIFSSTSRGTTDIFCMRTVSAGVIVTSRYRFAIFSAKRRARNKRVGVRFLRERISSRDGTGRERIGGGKGRGRGARNTALT